MQGWITLHRKIEENDLWLAEPFTRGQAWVDLLLIANHKPQLLHKRNIPIKIERGQVGWSRERLAKRWKWGRKKVTSFLLFLENAHQIKIDNNHTLSRIIIVNYDKYQKKEQQSHNSRTTDRTNNNNDNNDNNTTEPSSEELKANQSDKMWNKYSDDFEEELQVDPDYTPKGKPKKTKKVSDDVQAVFDLFNNPASALWRMREIERVAAQALFDSYGLETLGKRIKRIAIEKKKNADDQFFPLVTTPSQLLDKMEAVERYLKHE